MRAAKVLRRTHLWHTGLLLSYRSFATGMSSQRPEAAVVFLHGLGDTPSGWSSLEDQLPQLRKELSKKNVRYEFPAAPTIPLTINGGATMPGWFDLYDWPIAVGSKDDEKKLIAGVKTIHEVVKRLKSEGAKRIVIGGFSQGGAVALLSTYHPLASSAPGIVGCVSLSGWLTLVNDLEPGTDRVPLYWGHGTYDDKVLFEQQAFGVEQLQKVGVSSIESDQFPIGHSSHPKELKAMADFLVKVLFPEQAAEKSNKFEL